MPCSAHTCKAQRTGTNIPSAPEGRVHFTQKDQGRTVRTHTNRSPLSTGAGGTVHQPRLGPGILFRRRPPNDSSEGLHPAGVLACALESSCFGCIGLTDCMLACCTNPCNLQHQLSGLELAPRFAPNDTRGEPLVLEGLRVGEHIQPGPQDFGDEAEGKLACLSVRGRMVNKEGMTLHWCRLRQGLL